MVNDKRNRQRLPFFARARIKSRSGVVAAVGELSDISMNGLYMTTQSAVATGESCAVEIMLQGEDSTLTVQATGKVVRDSSTGVGVKFDQAMEWWPLFPMYQWKSTQLQHMQAKPYLWG